MSDNGLTAEKLRDLRTKTVTGSLWAGAGSLGRQFLTLIFSIWLTRLLLPSEFGLLGMVMVITVFARAVMTMGLSPAIIREPKLGPELYNTAFSLQLFMGLAFGLLLATGAPLVAAFYGEPSLTPLARLLSLDLMMVAGYSILRARLRRELRFKTITGVGLAATGIGGVVGVVCAWHDLGVYSLVAMLLCEQLLMLIGFWILTPNRPLPIPSRPAARQLLAYGSPLTVSLIVRRTVLVMDNMLIGKYFGEKDLGLYSRAFTLMLLPVKQISGVLMQVLLPAFSRVQDEHQMFRDGFLRATALIALVTFPMMTGMAVTAEHFVLGIFGTAWGELIIVLRIMCWAGALLSITNTSWIIFTATGETKKGMVWNVIFNSIMLLGFVGGILTGSLVQFALIYTLLQLVLHIPKFHVAGRLIGLKYIQVLKSLSGVILSCAIMGLTVWGVEWLVPTSWPHLLILFLETGVGILVYWIAIHVGRLAAYHELLELLRDQYQALRQKPTT